LEDGFTVIHLDLGWDWTNLYVPSKPSDRVKKVLAAHEEHQLEGPWMGRFEGMSQGLAEHARKLFGALTALVGDVVLVVDPPKTELIVNPECGLLVVTSPSAQRITTFNSFGKSDNFYLSVWTEEELRSLLMKRKGAPLSEKEEEELALRFLRFGGIPRFVAQPDEDHATMVSRAEDETKAVIAKLEGASMRYA
jgi:hypothetical protein